MTVEKLRLCCDTKPIIVKENPRYGKDKLLRIRCPKCGAQTDAKRYYGNAVEEWNHTDNLGRR